MGNKEAIQPGEARQEGPSLRDELLADPTPPPKPYWKSHMNSLEITTYHMKAI